MHRYTTTWLILAVLILPSSLFAANEAIQRVNNQAAVAFQWTDLDYEETLSGRSLDAVTGGAPGVSISFTKTLDHFMVNPSMRFMLGDLTYWGGFNGDTSGATLTADTENFIFDTDIKVGYVFELDDETTLIPYIQTGYRRWNREVPPVGTLIVDNQPTNIGVNGYTEVYENQSVLLGMMGQRALGERLVLMAFAAGGTTFNAKLFSNVPFPDVLPGVATVSLDERLGSEPIYQLGLKGDYRAGERLHFIGGVDYTRFQFGRSDGNAVLLFEPDSTTQEWRVSLGVAFDFG